MKSFNKMNEANINRDITASDEMTVVFELSDGVEVEMLGEGSKWREGRVVSGEEPYGWGSKTYQGYLTADDVEFWLSRDYGHARIIDAY